MCEIECAQLHNELLGRRHSTLQWCGFLALDKHLYCFVVILASRSLLVNKDDYEHIYLPNL